MNSELLDSLLLDRELGELTPAVVALLDEHLARDPAAMQRAAEFRGTVDLARRAVTSPQVQPAQALDVAQLHHAQRAALAASRRTQLYRLAACLALGVGLGWFARPGPPAASVRAELTPQDSRVASAPTEPRSTFWSVARLAANQRSLSAPSTSPRTPLR
jgi:hypothetical protein